MGTIPNNPASPSWPSAAPGERIGTPIETIIHDVQVEFDALAQDWCDRDYIIGFLKIHNKDIENLLEDLDLAYDEVILIVPGVPAGTCDLSSIQRTGGVLANMFLPTTLEWRLVGQTDIQWVPIPDQDKITDVLLGVPGGPSQVEGIASYKWSNGIISISPSSVPVDLRITFEQLPAVLNNDATQFIKGLDNCLIYGICEHIAMNRGGGMAKMGPWFKDKYDNAMSLVTDRMVKNEQVVDRRMNGRRSMQPGPLWRLPMG